MTSPDMRYSRVASGLRLLEAKVEEAGVLCTCALPELLAVLFERLVENSRCSAAQVHTDLPHRFVLGKLQRQCHVPCRQKVTRLVRIS